MGNYFDTDASSNSVFNQPRKGSERARRIKAPSDCTLAHGEKRSRTESDTEGARGDAVMNTRSKIRQEDPLLGYTFKRFALGDGDFVRRLVDREGNPFEFDVSERHQENEKRYEKLGEGITQYVYSLLESDECGLHKEYIPEGGAKGDDQRAFFFASQNAFTTKDRLLILINGSGAVRAGQWARRLIVNESLEAGTQLPYIQLAKQASYEIIVLNTNYNWYKNRNGVKIHIKGSEDPEAHALYVWDKYIAKRAKAEHIAIVAHSYGGVVATHLACQRWTEGFSGRVFAVAFTDSVHSLSQFHRCKHLYDVRQFYASHARNWVSSDLLLDEAVEGGRGQKSSTGGGRQGSQGSPQVNDAPRFSAGTKDHGSTSDKSKLSVFHFLAEQYNLRLSSPPSPNPPRRPLPPAPRPR